MSKNGINNIIGSANVYVNNLLVKFRLNGNDTCDMEADSFFSFINSKESFDGFFIAKVAVNNFNFFRKIFCGRIVRKNESANFFAFFNKLAANCAAEESGRTGYKINCVFHKNPPHKTKNGIVLLIISHNVVSWNNRTKQCVGIIKYSFHSES